MKNKIIFLAVLGAFLNSESTLYADYEESGWYQIMCPSNVSVTKEDGGSYSYSSRSKEVTFSGTGKVILGNNCLQNGKKLSCTATPVRAVISDDNLDKASCSYNVENRSTGIPITLWLVGDLNSKNCSLIHESGKVGFECKK